jgi:transcriptional regulator with XRE-family HTH domain
VCYPYWGVDRHLARRKMTENEQELRVQRGQLIAQLREEKFWTREQLAKEAGVSITTVTHAEAGVTHLRLSTMQKLAEALGADPRLLLHPEEALGKGLAPLSTR